MKAIIGDVAGQFDALMRIVKRLEPGTEIILVGDLNDRGPKSKEVIEWAMNTPNVTTLHSNHGDMFVDHVRKHWDGDYEASYHEMDFYRNGGLATLRSYSSAESPRQATLDVPLDHIHWLSKRPLFYVDEDLIVSHAPVPEGLDLKRPAMSLIDIVWNRREPVLIEGKLQVFGHNSHWGMRTFSEPDGGPVYAMCIDTSRDNVLTAFVFPSLELIQEDYVVKSDS